MGRRSPSRRRWRRWRRDKMGDAIHRATIVFDLDGTIADTAGDLIDAANAALIAEGFAPASAEAIRRGVGYGAKAMIRCALASTGAAADEDRARRIAERLVAHYEEHIAVKTRFFPGFLEAAHDLRRGAPGSLCARTSRRRSRRGCLPRSAPARCSTPRPAAIPFHSTSPTRATSPNSSRGREAISASPLWSETARPTSQPRGEREFRCSRCGSATPPRPRRSLARTRSSSASRSLPGLVEARLRPARERAY